MSVQTVSSAETPTLPILKRTRTSSSSSVEDPPPKKNMWYYVLAPEVPNDSDDGSESVYSIQDKSTDYVRDTSDTSTKYSSDEEVNMVEFEVVSHSDEDINPLPSDSGSSLPDVSHSPFDFEIPSKFESDTFADSSSVCSGGDNETKDNDPELAPADFWTCVRCKEQNNTPLFRYCERCYKIRKNFFPPRPQGRRNKNKSKPESVAREGDSQDSGVTASSSRSNSLGDDLCEICFSQPKDGGYYHGSVTHVYSCYSCSKRTLKQLGRCPICKLRVKQVVRIIKV